MKPSKEHLEVLLALAGGRQHRWLWERPMLRLTLARHGLIVAAGPPTSPWPHPRTKPQRQRFAVTAKGMAELERAPARQAGRSTGVMTILELEVLTELQDAYVADRAEVQRAALLPSATPLDTCRYCRRRWQKLHGSRLDGHSLCVVSEEFRTRLHRLMCDPKLTYSAVAKALGVTIAVVRAWRIAADRTRRGAA